MRELGDPNDTLEQHLERRHIMDPKLDLLDTDDEDDFLDITNNTDLDL